MHLTAEGNRCQIVLRAGLVGITILLRMPKKPATKIARVPAKAGRDSLIAIWIDWRRNLRIRPWWLVGCIHPAQEKSLQIRQIELSVAVPAPCKVIAKKRSR